MTAVVCSVSCRNHNKQELKQTPWGAIGDTTALDGTFDLAEIQTNGELIALTLNGPDTYYEYKGKFLGKQYLMAQRFADRVGVGLRVEVCRDTAEMLQRLEAGEADLICYPMSNRGIGWKVGKGKKNLRKELAAWYTPNILEDVKREEDFLLSAQSVKRKVFAPMLNAKNGVISHYDALFQRYAQPIRWDWRLMAAQCYQESTFDPQAKSWAGACGLMQIMPSTADHLGLERSVIFDPEQNIAAASRYINELSQTFSDIGNRNERTKFVLAAYNGGHFHIRDAMALAKKYGKNPQRWADVDAYVLKLSQPEFYNDPVVKHGYMRGSETSDYVSKIMDRWNGYRGIRTVHSSAAMAGVPQRATHARKKKYQAF